MSEEHKVTMEKIRALLVQNMTSEGYELMRTLLQKIKPVWDRLTSSSKRYHQRQDGSVPSIAEHTHEMLFAAVKVMRLLGAEPDTKTADVICLAVLLHDSLKYGEDPEGKPHTTNLHDRIAGDFIRENEDLLRDHLGIANLMILETAVRFHSGRWSSDAKEHIPMVFNNTETLFVHILDMLSTADVLKVH